MINLLNKRKSFTLIEALMAVAMFMIITTILINIYIATVRAERIAYTILRDSDVTQIVLETMARAIRMGSDFEVTDQSLKFKTEEEGKSFITMFNYVSNNDKGWIERIKDVENANDTIRLIPENMSVEDFKFEILGNTDEQRIILVKFNVVSEVYGSKYKTFVQTSIAPRLIVIN